MEFENYSKIALNVDNNRRRRDNLINRKIVFYVVIYLRNRSTVEMRYRIF